jgi:hypothetical protein
MSRTDKTNPYWVQVNRREGNIKPWRIYHVRTCDGTCMPGIPLPHRPRYTDCEIWFRYSENNRFYGRQPRRATRKLIGREGGIRTKLVAQRRAWALERDREGIDSYAGAPKQPRCVIDRWWLD